MRHAKLTGEVGVCLATSGPGAIHLLNGLYDAKLDHQPVVAIVGQQARMSLGADYQQEVDLHALFKDVAAEFVQTVMVPEQVRTARPRAAHRARPHGHCDHRPQRRAGADLRAAAARARRRPLDVAFEPPRVPATRTWPRGRRAQRRGAVAMLVGQGAHGARGEVAEVAELLGAGVARALQRPRGPSRTTCRG